MGEQRPVMIHRAILGSLERFSAILTEHVEGKWPFWISPRQVCVVPITQDNIPYAERIGKIIHDAGFWCDVDSSTNQFRKKIALAMDPKDHRPTYNMCLVVGGEEEKSETVNVRMRGTKKGGETLGKMSIDDVLKKMKQMAADFE